MHAPDPDDGAAGEDPRRAVLARLARQTDDLRSRPAPDQQQVAREREREKAVVHECRYLMRLLATRRRSEGEMRERLARREVPAGVAHETMARIARAGLVDDEAFAREWVAQRRELRGLSDEALRRELVSRRVDAETIESALAAGRHPGADAEEQQARDLVRARLGRESPAALRLTAEDPQERARLSRRLDGYLRRRGYDGALAVRVVTSEILHATGR